MSEFEYACTFYLEVVNSKPHYKFHSYDVELVSEKFDLWDMILFDADFCPESVDELRHLEDGLYYVFARGVAVYEPEVDWESGIDEGGFILGTDKVIVRKLEDEDDTVSDGNL